MALSTTPKNLSIYEAELLNNVSMIHVFFFFLVQLSLIVEWYQKVMIWQKEMYRTYNLHEQMALKAASQLFTYSTVSATTSPDSQPADWIDGLLHAGAELRRRLQNLCDSKWQWHFLSSVCVCVWICVVVLRDPSTPQRPKSHVSFFDLRNVTRTLSCSSQGLNILVLNKPPWWFFFI